MNNLKDILEEEKNTMPFILSKYMLSLILPKCNMVYGEALSTVYFQIAININRQKNCLSWQKNVSWIQIGSISEKTGYNTRTVTKFIKILQDLYLIKIEHQGKLNKFRLLNHQIQSEIDINNFNLLIENVLLKGMNKTKTQKFKLMFDELETLIQYQKLLKSKELSKCFHFQDINLLRNWIYQSEKIYKGSTLFFLVNIAPQIFKYTNGDINELIFISERGRAVQIGSSQSTVSRYINSFIENGCLIVEEGNINKPVRLGVNKNFINQKQNIIFDRVVKEMSEELMCPICNKPFAENRSLSIHLMKIKDPKHILLNHLKQQSKCGSDGIVDLYAMNKEDFDELDNIDFPKQESKPKPVDNYMKISCNCTLSCKECRKNWKLDFYNDCTHERKQAYINEYGLEEQEEKKLVKTASRNNTIQVTKEDFDIVKPTKKARKQMSPDAAPSILKYFYDLTGGTSPNFGKECSQIKNLLNKGVTPEQIRMTMDYLHKKGSFDLRFLNNSVNDAMLQKQYIEESENEGTEAFLVKMYYTGLGLNINLQTLIKDVQKIKETLNSGLTYEQTKLVIKYMVDTKCPTLNFIGSKRNEALAQVKNNSNPSLFDRSDMVVIENELINARTSLSKVDDKLKSEAYLIAKKIFKEQRFTNRFSHFEWAWKVGLDLDCEMYQTALKSKSNESTFDKMINDPKVNDEQKQKIIMIKERFENWLNKQSKNFGTSI